jgi:hypothetical protein
MVGATTELEQQAARARLDFIDRSLTRTGRHARLWAWGWGVGIGVSGVASLAVVPFVSRADRVDWYTSAGSAAIGVFPFLFSPLAVAHDGPTLHAKLSADTSDADVCPLLAEAEALLIRDAENERQQQAWYLHAGNLAFNTGVLLFLGLGFHHWASGIINGAAGAAVGEAIIFTQPTQTIDALTAYRAGDLTSERAPPLTLGYATKF